MQTDIDPGSGLTAEERRIITFLSSAWNMLIQLPDLPADDKADFQRAIHDAERIIAQRALARAYPEFWR